jgi:hypothetical protein
MELVVSQVAAKSSASVFCYIWCLAVTLTPACVPVVVPRWVFHQIASRWFRSVRVIVEATSSPVSLHPYYALLPKLKPDQYVCPAPKACR